MKTRDILMSALLVVALLCPLNESFSANGYLAQSVSAVNDGLGGASVCGTPGDVIGSLYRNPANSLIYNGTVGAVGIGVILPDAELESSLTLPGLSMNGKSSLDVDMMPIASFAIVHNDENTPTAYYFGIIPEAGLHLKFKESMTNPILLPQADKPNNPFGGLLGGVGKIENIVRLLCPPLLV